MNRLQEDIRDQIIADFADRPQEVTVVRLIEAVFDYVERNASKRAIVALIDSMGDEAHKRYLYDPVFHALVDTLAQVFVHAALGDAPLSASERAQRVKDLDLMQDHLTSMASLGLTDRRADAPDSRTP